MGIYLYKYRYWFVASILLAIGTALMIPFLGELLLSNIITHKDTLVTRLTNALHPRLSTEIQRLPNSFFEAKINLLRIRTTIAALLLPALPYVKKRINASRALVNKSYLIRTRFVFYISFLLLTYSWTWEIPALYTIKEFYNPVSFLSFSNLPLPNTTALSILILLYFLSGICSAFAIKTKLSTWIFSILFIYIYGLQQSFGKTDQGYSTICLSLLIFPLVLSSNGKRQAQFFSFLQVLVVLPYFYAALEKLSIGGLEWFSGNNLHFYLSLSSNNIANYIATNHFLVVAFSLLVIAFQFGFIFFLRNPKVKIGFMIFGVLFHYSITFLMDINIYFNPWLLCYIFLLDDIKLNLSNKRYTKQNKEALV